MGMDFDPEMVTRTNPLFSFSRPAYNSFIKDHRQATYDVYVHEYIAFLTYSLSRYVFTLDSFR